MIFGKAGVALAALAGLTAAAVADPSRLAIQPPGSAKVAWNSVNATAAAPGGSSAHYLAPDRSGIQEAVERRLEEKLTPEMVRNFGLFVYVSKAESGPWAQRMVVFQKAADSLLPLYDWPVSTGRETIEADAQGVELPTDTPPGYYELDPGRFYVDHRSSQWDEQMPYAMFFNWVHDGVSTGLAIHAATEADMVSLGTRASAGCVRLAPENARTLFTLIQDNYKGQAPKFVYDKYTATTMNNGLILHDSEGNVKMAPGYSVLVYIDDYGGQMLEAEAY